MRYQRGEKWWPIPNASDEQELRYSQDAWEELIAEYLIKVERTTVYEVLWHCLHLPLDRHGKSEQTRIGNILRRLGWKRKQETQAEDRKRYFVPAKHT